MAAAEPCSCLDCSCCPNPPAATRERSVKRKLDPAESKGIDPDGCLDRNDDEDEYEDEDQDPGQALEALLVRVGAEDECGALREALASQQKTIQELYLELEEERDASSSAANETMSMILRLQREKAELQLEARQFRSYAEEKMAHDQEELAALEEALSRREEAVEALSQEIEALRSRLAVCGVDPDAVLRDLEEYPALRCESGEFNREGSGEAVDDALSDGGSEKLVNVEEKEVVAGNSPPPRAEVQREEDFPDDRIYTVDAVHAPASVERGDSPRVSVGRSTGVEEEEIKKLYVRLQALEADRESLKETISSMRADTAQLELLKMIAQNLSKGVAAQQSIEGQDQGASRELSSVGGSFWTSLFKWIWSFRLWNKKTRICRYSFGISNNNPGLLLLITRPQSSHLGHRCVTRWGGPLYHQHQP